MLTNQVIVCNICSIKNTTYRVSVRLLFSLYLEKIYLNKQAFGNVFIPKVNYFWDLKKLHYFSETFGKWCGIVVGGISKILSKNPIESTTMPFVSQINIMVRYNPNRP